jgi:hypothetical protein
MRTTSRLLTFPLALLTLSGASASAQLPDVAQGARLRVTLSAEDAPRAQRVTGKFVRQHADSIYLERADIDPALRMRAIAIADVEQVERSVAHRSFRLIGVIVGGLVGARVGASLASSGAKKQSRGSGSNCGRGGIAPYDAACALASSIGDQFASGLETAGRRASGGLLGLLGGMTIGGAIGGSINLDTWKLLDVTGSR